MTNVCQSDYVAVLDVVVPCYNAAATLRRAAESALAQPEVQTVWLVDDGSDDETRAVMAQLAAEYPRIRCEYLPQNGGAAKARNWGALQSQADFVAFLDADDAYEPHALAAAYLALAKFDYIGLVRLKLQPSGFPQHYLDHADFQTAWRRLEMSGAGNTVFRRNVLLACGGFPQHDLFRRFDGEDAALGIALMRISVVGTLFGEHDAAVTHIYRPGIHAAQLLDSALFGHQPPSIGAVHRQQAEAVTADICRRFRHIQSQSALGQSGIMPLQVSYEES